MNLQPEFDFTFTIFNYLFTDILYHTHIFIYTLLVFYETLHYFQETCRLEEPQLSWGSTNIHLNRCNSASIVYSTVRAIKLIGLRERERERWADVDVQKKRNDSRQKCCRMTFVSLL